MVHNIIGVFFDQLHISIKVDPFPPKRKPSVSKFIRKHDPTKGLIISVLQVAQPKAQGYGGYSFANMEKTRRNLLRCRIRENFFPSNINTRLTCRKGAISEYVKIIRNIAK